MMAVIVIASTRTSAFGYHLSLSILGILHVACSIPIELHQNFNSCTRRVFLQQSFISVEIIEPLTSEHIRIPGSCPSSS
jgi:hypothetical protein